MTRPLLLVLAVATAILPNIDAPWALSPRSKTITEIIREPLPPEELTCLTEDSRIIVEGPTFRYTVDRASGGITGLEVERDGRVVASLQGPVDLWIDDVHLADCRDGITRVLVQGKDQVLLVTKGTLGSHLPYVLKNTFYNDGVVVSEITLTPKKDLALRHGIGHRIAATGCFSQYLHKRRDTNGTDCFKGDLPADGRTQELTTLTSCLEVFSPEAALAVFTDRGGSHRWPAEVGTASLEVGKKTGDDTSVVLTQHIVRIEPGGPVYVLPSGEEFTFRTGLAVAPNRLPHPRWRDLRMFIWIGDEAHPYPSDEEIFSAAHLGFTLFQMHRLGTPGQPRPPAEEFDRVLKTVHEAGMLFIWTANADLLYANSKGATEMRKAGKWPLWQGFNYGGNYRASMDPYCNLAATCLASPNGLADYRIQTITEMLDAYAVDGMYIDDNLPYANCHLWKKHGHPEQTYDCLIELHDMNWRRRRLLRSKRPHAVLIDHCSHGFVLPSIADFDCHLFGEGYSFPSVEAYWNTYGSFQNMPAQGCLWAGDSESNRCGAEIAYAFDLLTGGGQYSYLDWRLWPKKFPYAAGVNSREPLFVKTYNLAQYYFGMYESEPYYFARSKERFTATAANTYATLYHNRTWNEALVVVANMNESATSTSVVFAPPAIPPLEGDRPFAVYDVHQRTVANVRGREALEQFADLDLAPHQVRLFSVRETPENPVYHLWGGKRISENWDGQAQTLSVQLHGPAGLKDMVVFGVMGKGIERVTVNGSSAEFSIDPSGGIVHGEVTFDREPVTLEAIVAPEGRGRLAERSVTPDELSESYSVERE